MREWEEEKKSIGISVPCALRGADYRLLLLPLHCIVDLAHVHNFTRHSDIE
jgi:hypothetical protein